MKEIKELIYKDAQLLECLFNNVGFNLHECAVTQQEMDDITKFRKALGRGLVENISKIVKLPIEDDSTIDAESSFEEPEKQKNKKTNN